MVRLQALALVFTGGFAGTLLRHGVNEALGSPRLWLATLSVNLLGAFALGFFFGWLERRLTGHTQLRLLLVTGFLGGFTTYSTFALQSVNLHDTTDLLWAACYGIGTVVAGGLASWGGLVLGRRFDREDSLPRIPGGGQ